MLRALPALPGVGLIVIVVVLACPRWVSRQRGAVKGVRVAGGDVPGLGGEVQAGECAGVSHSFNRSPRLSIALNANVLATVLLPVSLVFMVILANDTG